MRAGPRQKLALDPLTVRAAVVTCGGLCPGLNDVIRQIVTTLESGYGVSDIVGVPYGYRGFFEPGLEMKPLSRRVVQNIHLEGGSILGTSRGGGDVPKIVDSIMERGINALFLLGGNGTHAGAQAITDECMRRGYRCAVVGVPKTIDNECVAPRSGAAQPRLFAPRVFSAKKSEIIALLTHTHFVRPLHSILYIDKTFGFDTAVEEAQRALRAASIEAKSAYRGVGVVKLMGRQSGFIATYASIASGEVDICLIPEVNFQVDGDVGILQHVKHLIETQGHAIICLAEGAGQDYVASTGTDASGNPILGDIGVWMCKKIRKELGADVKYIDPTYMVRGCTANAHDKVYCNILGQNAAHAAMAGFTGISVGLVNTHYVYLPIPMLIAKPRFVDPNSRMYQARNNILLLFLRLCVCESELTRYASPQRLLSSTGQPDFM